MLSEFEQQVQETLRLRVTPDIRNEVQVATGANSQTGILIGVRSAIPARPEFNSHRPERVPGANDPRRVVRLHCQFSIDFVPQDQNEGRDVLVGRLDQVLYALDTDDVHDGTAFAGNNPDPGFTIKRMALETLDMPFYIHVSGAEAIRLVFAVDGFFWPVGEIGQTGVLIGEVRLRGAVLPVLIDPAAPTLVAGGAAVTLTVSFDGLGTSQITAAALNSVSFGNVAAWLEKSDGTSGEGTLSGGTAGVGNIRLYAVTTGQAVVTYTPPATPTTDVLVLALEDGEDGSGIQIGRFPLEVRVSS